MGKVIIEIPIVSKCDIKKCGYNVNNNCHAKAITVGDEMNPGCDTFFENKSHSRETKRIAGVGACKVSSCRHNNDYECTAEGVSVGFSDGKINCLTYKAKV